MIATQINLSIYIKSHGRGYFDSMYEVIYETNCTIHHAILLNPQISCPLQASF